MGFGFSVAGLGFSVGGFRVQGSGFRVWCWGLWFGFGVPRLTC